MRARWEIRTPAAAGRRGLLSQVCAVIQRWRGQRREQAYLERSDHRIGLELLAHGFRAEDEDAPEDRAP